MPMPPLTVKTVRFPAYLHIVPLAILFLFLFGYISPDNSGLALLALLTNAIVFCYQLYFLSKIGGSRRVYKAERDLLIGSLLILIGLMVGHVAGYNNFPGSSTSLQSGLFGALTVYLALVLLLALILSLANTIYLYIRIGSILRFLGYLGLAALWLLIAIISFLGFSVMYTIHDPNTE